MFKYIGERQKFRVSTRTRIEWEYRWDILSGSTVSGPCWNVVVRVVMPYVYGRQTIVGSG